MPHIHLETSANLPENEAIPDILAELVVALALCETVNPASIKAYHTLRHTWAMGEGAPEGFVHCCASVLSGRTVELRQTMGRELGAVLRSRFAASLESCEAGLTIEIREMDAETYIK